MCGVCVYIWYGTLYYLSMDTTAAAAIATVTIIFVAVMVFIWVITGSALIVSATGVAALLGGAGAWFLPRILDRVLS